LEGLAARLGSPEEALQSKAEMDKNVRMALANLEDWRETYPNRWIAVYKQKLIAATSSRAELLKVLHQEQVPLRDVYVDFISEEKSALML
jgi:hypothetical protein